MKDPIHKREAADAELALKAYVARSHPQIVAAILDGKRTMQEIADAVDLTEAPEDAVCSLVIDLMHYCEQEKIDWTHDVMRRAEKRFVSKRTRARRVPSMT